MDGGEDFRTHFLASAGLYLGIKGDFFNYQVIACWYG